MKPDLQEIPFDHFQRYAAASALVDSLDNAPNVLEVGANRQRLLDEFLPGRRIIFSDLDQQDCDDGRFVRADATELPFADDAFDCVVSLDVLEHIPVQLRAKAVAEMGRVAKRLVVIACPLDRPWVHEAEEGANRIWREFQGGISYPWLEEHKEFGLVAPEDVEVAMTAGGWQVLRFGQGNLDLWNSMMGSHFLKEAVGELAPVVAAADRLYNRNVFAGDRSEKSYREFFIAVRADSDRAAIEASLPLVGAADEASVQMLTSLADSMVGVVRRTRHAEENWASTAEVARQFEAKANEADREREIVKAREALLLSHIEGASQREAHMRQLLDASVEREGFMRDQIETAARKNIEASEGQAQALQKYTDLLDEHSRSIVAARHRWRMMSITALVLLIINVAMITAYVLRGYA
ncbi:class I SAM-dependent methyltransferase [Lysobacter soli]|uniref:class I SAM-dependent methyltransferase n=1 Tax=Lysobacter soli TaxID=453783 RepID=UPI00209F6B64|nr:class I SAM-dependent methyltransferase [Lysobacter soli]UTA54192.1 class I SAM-dependent methyltransferase [Lysobacter soli]